MGSVAKAVKKVTKRISRPISKITKGIAKGIVKVGKATMRGVAKIQNKLGPLGSIAMAIAMPYALGGLSNIVGHAGMAAGQSSGLLGSSNVFLRSIGTVGNAVRTGYQGVTGFVGRAMSGITKSITKGFSNMGKGNNIFSRISNGAKTLFQKSRAAVQKFKPMTAKGNVDVTGFVEATGPAEMAGNKFITSNMSTTRAGKLLSDGIISGDQLTGQTFGKTGWLTKANPMDKAISEAINTTYEANVMTGFDSSAKKAFLDYKTAADAGGQPYNYENINNMMSNNLNTVGTSDGVTTSFNFEKSGDYNMRAGGGGGQGTYEFNGNKSFRTNNGASTLTKIKEAAKSKALDALKNNLLSPTAAIPIQDFTGLMGDATQQTSGNTMYGGTNIHGSSGGSLLEGTFNKAQQEQIMTYYKNMNIIGSQ